MVKEIYSGKVGRHHCQGIAVDEAGGYIYYSFTTSLVKCTLDGRTVGSVENIAGHLGCIVYDSRTRRIYASLEYKHDAIGKGILGKDYRQVDEGFYIAIFDGDKIDRPRMDAEKDGVMRAAYLSTVFEDYSGEDFGALHNHGCSGIDGVAIGPDFGAEDGAKYLHVCYGIYGDTQRTDNDYQIILQYDTDELYKSARPLLQDDMHKNGPKQPKNKYFLYTGNTCWGIQNLEYDEFSHSYIAATYPGRKPQFPNYPMFIIDAGVRPVEAELSGLGIFGKLLTLKDTGLSQNGIFGIDFPLGSTGIYSFGDGHFYFSVPEKDADGYQSSTVRLYRLSCEGKWSFFAV